jgi:glycosyltransferase involved in cell wall biosynthesis
MKVLHVLPSFAPAWRYGGPVRAAFELSREQARQGAEVSVYTTNIDGPSDLDVPTGRPLSMEGVRVTYFPVQFPRSYSFSLGLSRALRDTVRRFDIVHVHSVFNWALSPSAYYCRRFRIPYVVRPCGMLDPVAIDKPYEPAWRSLAGRIKKKIYLGLVEGGHLQSAAALHFTCRRELEQSRWAARDVPGFITPLGITPLELPPDRPRFGLPPQATVILFLSRIDRKKGLDLLLAGFEKIARDEPRAWLAVAGDGSPEYVREVKARVQRIPRARWLGPVEGETKWALLRSADLFVLPSHHENFALAAAEAMGAGLPVVVSDRVGVAESVLESGGGLVTRCESTEVAEAMERLLRHPEERSRMGALARRRARQAFQWPGIARDVLDEYRRILDS